MKYIIFFCLLFVFIYSRKEFKHKFSFENSLTSKSYDTNIKKSKCDADTKDECKALKNPDEDEICCYFERKINGETDYEDCEDFPTNIDKRAEIVNSKEYKAYYREEKGYRIYVEEEDLDKIEEKITCKKGVYSAVFENNFSETEKKNLKDENHCLNIYHKKDNNYKFDVGECKDYLLLDSSKKVGLDCGYFEYNIVLKSERTVSYKTCNLFNLKLYSNINKIKNVFSDYDIENIIDSMEIEGEIESFTAEAYNSKGDKIKYDSKTDKTIVEGSGYMLTVSKYLFFLILILF